MQYAICAQVKLIREKFQAALGDDARLVDINTIDGFQVLLCVMVSVCFNNDGLIMKCYDFVAMLRPPGKQLKNLQQHVSVHAVLAHVSVGMQMQFWLNQ